MLELKEVNSDLETRCLLTTRSNDTYDGDLEESFCSPVWDTVYCWPPTPSGTKTNRSCSEIFEESYSEYAAHLQGFAYRVCLENGTWENGLETNYDQCSDSFQSYLNGIKEDNMLVPIVHQMLFWGSILSLLCLGTSLLVFYKFRCLQCDRVTIHAQLMLSLFLRFILMLTISEPFVIGHTYSYRDVEFLCKTILVLFLYFTFSSISWMFVQGLYLNIALMKGAVMSSTTYQLTIYHVIGWGLPAGFIGAYVIFMTVGSQESCWKGYSDMDEMWIISLPIIIQLAINGVFLLNIVRILLRKVRSSTSRPDSSQLKAAAKATVILFPVLGINYLVFLYNPGGDYNKYFQMLDTFFGSTQGIYVSIVFCFADKEVHAAIQRAMNRVNARRTGNSNRVPSNESPRSTETTCRRENDQCEGDVVENTV